MEPLAPAPLRPRERRERVQGPARALWRDPCYGALELSVPAYARAPGGRPRRGQHRGPQAERLRAGLERRFAPDLRGGV